MTADDQWAESAVARTRGTLAQLNADFGDAPARPVTATLPGVIATSGPKPTERVDVTIDDIYRTHRMGMVRLAILLVDDQASAEDVVQEAFAGMFRNWSGLRDNAAAIGYLRTAG